MAAGRRPLMTVRRGAGGVGVPPDRRVWRWLCVVLVDFRLGRARCYCSSAWRGRKRAPSVGGGDAGPASLTSMQGPAGLKEEWRDEVVVAIRAGRAIQPHAFAPPRPSALAALRQTWSTAQRQRPTLPPSPPPLPAHLKVSLERGASITSKVTLSRRPLSLSHHPLGSALII